MAEYVNKIECPNCGATINVEDVLAHKIEENLRGKIDVEYKEKLNTLNKKEKEIAELKKNQEAYIKDEIKKREQAFKDELAAEYKTDYEKKYHHLRSN